MQISLHRHKYTLSHTHTAIHTSAHVCVREKERPTIRFGFVAVVGCRCSGCRLTGLTELEVALVGCHLGDVLPPGFS